MSHRNFSNRPSAVSDAVVLGEAIEAAASRLLFEWFDQGRWSRRPHELPGSLLHSGRTLKALVNRATRLTTLAFLSLSLRQLELLSPNLPSNHLPSLV
jgi:hypothetical protein